ncbi:M48 family metalloprotease [Microtetraspora niveoalba]|uniref:M48 family metalloprotease n=1 Tax=Microtetraspora niveoalba TaxID=46175 RepID=UPI000834EDF4|nr:M48 family metalloprotease [Microtetraspora niveoalba]
MVAVASWSRRIAEQITPAEAPSAELTGAAYVAGGRRRRELLGGGAGAEPGGFGAGAPIGELPFILDGLRAVSGDLLGLLSAQPLVNLLLLVALNRARGASGPHPPAADEAADGPGDPRPEPVLDQAIASFRDRLLAREVSADRAEELTYDTLKLVFQPDRDKAEIEAFLQALAGSPPAGRIRMDRSGRDRPPATGREASDWMPPPWLWFYFLGVTAPGVPYLLESLGQDIDGIGTLVAHLAEGVRLPATAILTGTGVVQMFPAVLLLAGAAGVLFPRTRGRWAERRHRLRPGGDPVVAEMTAFVRRHAAAVELRLGARHDRLARVYPVGWREARIAVYPPLIRLWQEDRPAAHAVLLHEIAHLRQGDHLIVGLASPFAWMVRAWGAALAALGLVPIVLYLVWGGPDAAPLLLSLLKGAAAVPIALILPVAGLWVAELGADRYAAGRVGAAALARALGPAASGRTPGRRFGRVLGGLTHPPVRTRLWALRSGPRGAAALAALWPSAIVVRLAAICLFEVLAYSLNGTPPPDAVAAVAGELPAKLAEARATLVELAVLLVNWPLLAPLWSRIWTPAPAARQRFAPYLLSALVPGVLVAGGAVAVDESPAPGQSQAVDIPATPGPPSAAPAPASPAPARPTGGPTLPSAAESVRETLVDVRPWGGAEPPVQFRFGGFTTLEQTGGPPEWKATAWGWLGAGSWRVERDGRLSFSTMAPHPAISPGLGGWLRQGDQVQFWLPIRTETGGGTTDTEIMGVIDLARRPAVMDASWAPKFGVAGTDVDVLLSAPMLRMVVTLDVYAAP